MLGARVQPAEQSGGLGGCVDFGPMLGFEFFDDRLEMLGGGNDATQVRVEGVLVAGAVCPRERSCVMEDILDVRVP